MPKKPIWVLDNAVTAIHKRQIAEHGGGDGVRDITLLESALGKPKNLYYYSNQEPTTAQLAASYAYGIAKNHPFVDGNKRTAFVVCNLFLELNGMKLNTTQQDKYQIFINLAEGSLSEEDLALWIDKYTQHKNITSTYN